MVSPRHTLPTSARLLLLLPGLLLLFGLAAGGVHHHQPGEGSHACTLCALSHAPAIAAATAPVSAPEQVAGFAHPAAPETPHSYHGAAISSRAPPSI